MATNELLPLTDVQREALASVDRLRRYTPKDRSAHDHRHDLDGRNVADATVEALFAHDLIRVNGTDRHGETTFALTDKGRALIGKPAVKVRWTRLADGSHRAIGLPVLIDGRDGRRDAPMQVRAPNYRDASKPDGWFWSGVVRNPEADAAGPAEFWSIPDAKAWVADNLGWVLQQADPDYDGDPALNADARAAATREWKERNAAFQAGQAADAAEYAADLTDEEEALLGLLHEMHPQRLRRVLDEMRKR